MNDQHIWWYVTRTSAILAWVLMTMSVVWGILLSTRILRKVDDAGKLQDLHRYLGGLSLIMVGLHMVSLMLDGWLGFTIGELFIPLETDYRPIPVALGIVAFYLLIAVYGSSLLRDRLPPRFWKGLHYASYGAVLLVSFHAGLSGTDTGSWWYLSLAVGLISLTAVSVIVRVLLSSRPAAAPVRSAVATNSAKARTPGLAITPRPAAVAPTGGPATAPSTTLVVADTSELAEGVRGIRLVPLGGAELPHWDPGAHLTLDLPGNLSRQYSLCGDPADHSRYEIAVLRETESRGGSAWLHDEMRAGMTVTAREPDNHFPLRAASSYLFIAGGIGITPIRAMIDSLPARRDWRLLYLGRSRSTMAFLPELLQEYPGHVLVYASDEHEMRLDIAEAIAKIDGDVYCCGPESLLDAVASTTEPTRLHLERFAPIDRHSAHLSAIRVDCARSGIALEVPADRSILELLEERSIPVVASCRRGVCGSCELRVLDGEVEHLDSVMADDEKNDLGIMFPCVSRALDGHLTLDV